MGALGEGESITKFWGAFLRQLCWRARAVWAWGSEVSKIAEREARAGKKQKKQKRNVVCVSFYC